MVQTNTPNPNNGTFVLRQATADDKPVSAEVFDMMGRLVYSGSITFTSKAATLSIGSVAPGAYLVKLQDTRARIFTFRFIVQ